MSLNSLSFQEQPKQVYWYTYLIINYVALLVTYFAVKHWKKYQQDVKVIMATFLISIHLMAFTAIFRFFEISNPWIIFLEMFIWCQITAGIGITAGPHRLWSHRSYKAKAPARLLMMIINSIANQGSILHWSTLHRAHHKHSDTLSDPHSSAKGLFYSHIGWLLFKKTKEQREAICSQSIKDLEADPIVMFQHKMDPWWNQFWCFVFPAIYAQYNDALTGFLILGVLRYLLVLHFTWCVNSLAHFIGYQTYGNIPARENWLVSIFAAGEGWHNWHHKYPTDYAAAETGFITQYNPTKMWIDFLWLIGQAYDLKRYKLKYKIVA